MYLWCVRHLKWIPCLDEVFHCFSLSWEQLKHWNMSLALICLLCCDFRCVFDSFSSSWLCSSIPTVFQRRKFSSYRLCVQDVCCGHQGLASEQTEVIVNVCPQTVLSVDGAAFLFFPLVAGFGHARYVSSVLDLWTERLLEVTHNLWRTSSWKHYQYHCMCYKTFSVKSLL